MQPLLILLATATLLSPPTAGRMGSTFDGTALLKQVVAMDLAAQRQWLRQIEWRYNRSAALTLPPDDAAKGRARVYALLRRKDIRVHLYK